MQAVSPSFSFHAQRAWMDLRVDLNWHLGFGSRCLLVSGTEEKEESDEEAEEPSEEQIWKEAEWQEDPWRMKSFAVENQEEEADTVKDQ